jgi:hypothetical protein
MCESKPNHLGSSSKRVVRNTYKGLYHTNAIPHRGRTQRLLLLPSELPFLFFLLLFYSKKVGVNMGSPDPTLPSITFILSRAQPALTTRGSTRRRGKFGVRRSKSSPSFGTPEGPHPPRYPPQLDSEFLEVRELLSITVPSSGADRRITSINC